MTDTQKNAAVVQAAERLFDFASEHIPQPTPKAAQDFADPDNYWHRAASAALPTTEQSLAGEVVMWMYRRGGMTTMFDQRLSEDDREGWTETPLYATPQPAPVTGEDAVEVLRKAAQNVLDRGYVSEHIDEERADHLALKDALAALSPSAPEAPSEREVIAELVEALEDARNNGFGEAFFRLHVDTLITRARKIGGAS